MNLLFIGPPGSGKGTQSKLLVQKYGIAHLSTGDMFRKALQDQTEIGLKAKAFMDRGEYVPDSVVIDLIRERLKEADCKNGFILDGFPRTVPQAQALDQMLSQMGKKLDRVLYFSVPKETLISRLSSRRTCRACGQIADVKDVESGKAAQTACKVSPPACDFYQRDDDKAEVIQKRIDVYEQQTTPVVDFYRQAGGLIDLEGTLAPDQVFQKIVTVLGS